MDYGRWQNKEWRYTEPSLSYLERQTELFEESLQQYCAICRIDRTRIEVNYQALKDVFCRVDMRELYFTVFHKGMQANEYKFVALECFWILKLKPLWISIDQSDTPEMMQVATCINEKFVTHLICMLLLEYNPRFFTRGKDLCADYLRELEYSFRYRDLSKESMYLMADPFYYMCLFDHSVDEDGNSRV